MAKNLIIICPECSKNKEKEVYIEAEPGFWNFLRRDARKIIKCRKGHTISMENGRMASKECTICKNDIVYDLLQGEDALCPVCKTTVNSEEDKHKNVTVSCPQCGCGMSVNKNANNSFTCPVCQHETKNIEKEIELVNITKSGLASVIKYEGNNNTFVWKHPVEDFNIGSQLIVHESQEAIFFRNGAALDLFTAGRYTLETESIPLINNLYNRVLDPKDVFHSEVYYVNMSTQMGIKWGTDSKVRFLEPITGIPLDIGASGEFNLRVSDSRKLVVKLVGTEGELERDKLLFTKNRPDDESSNKSVSGYFRSMIMTRVKTHLARTIKENQINILEIDEHLDSLSSALRARINEGLAEYGLMMPEFFVNTIVTPDEDPNFKRLKGLQLVNLGVREKEVAATLISAEVGVVSAQTTVAQAQREFELTKAQTAAQMKAIAAQGEAEQVRAVGLAEAEVMAKKGYSHKDELQADVQKAYAEGIGNMGGGGSSGGGGGSTIASDILSVVAGFKAADAVGGQLGNMFGGLGSQTIGTTPTPLPESTPESVVGGWDCPCGHNGNRGKFCEDCGAPQPMAWDCKCGSTGNKGKFCAECGAIKPSSWDCPCGEKSIKGNFCSNCGKKREELTDG